jgi:hypothetical protein
MGQLPQSDERREVQKKFFSSTRPCYHFDLTDEKNYWWVLALDLKVVAQVHAKA